MPDAVWTVLLAASLTVHASLPTPRTMPHGDPAIRRALELVGQRLDSIVIIERAEAREIYARTAGAGTLSDHVNAFSGRGAPAGRRIYVISESAVYRRASDAPATLATLKLAATLVHEQVHATDGDAAAYRLQADFVRRHLPAVRGAGHAEGRRYLEALEARALGLSPERLRLSQR